MSLFFLAPEESWGAPPWRCGAGFNSDLFLRARCPFFSRAGSDLGAPSVAVRGGAQPCRCRCELDVPLLRKYAPGRAARGARHAAQSRPFQRPPGPPGPLRGGSLLSARSVTLSFSFDTALNISCAPHPEKSFPYKTLRFRVRPVSHYLSCDTFPRHFFFFVSIMLHVPSSRRLGGRASREGPASSSLNRKH